MAVKSVKWINSIGFVCVVDEYTGKKKIYIGTGKGLSEEDDIKYILEWGSKVGPDLVEFLNQEV